MDRRSHFLCDKIRKGSDILLHGSLLKCGHVGLVALNPDNGPRISPRGQQSIQNESADPSVAIRVRVNVDKKEVPQYRPGSRRTVGCQQFEQGFEQFGDRFVRWRYVLRPPNEYRSVPITRQSVRGHQPGLHRRTEQGPIPCLEIVIDGSKPDPGLRGASISMKCD
jgi:hypothetical protein